MRRLLQWMTQDFAARGLDSPRLDAELLAAHALSVTRVALYMDLDRPLTGEELSKVRELVKRRRAREPVAYILGRRELYGRSFAVGPAVLIPRPDTEALIERALAILPPQSEARVLDLCTGSGCIAITIACERPGTRADATDLSAEALEVARENATSLGVAERVRLLQGDLYAALPEPARYALVVANPPYVALRERDQLAPDVAEHEPHAALFGGEDGLDVIRRLVAGLGEVIEPEGHALIEVGAGQAAAVEALLAALPWVERTERHRDLGGVERVVEAVARPKS